MLPPSESSAPITPTIASVPAIAGIRGISSGVAAGVGSVPYAVAPDTTHAALIRHQVRVDTGLACQLHDCERGLTTVEVAATENGARVRANYVGQAIGGYPGLLALLWQIFSGTEFPNQFLRDS